MGYVKPMLLAFSLGVLLGVSAALAAGRAWGGAEVRAEMCERECMGETWRMNGRVCECELAEGVWSEQWTSGD